ncbi:hypothetical protein BZG36_04398 [Bifiguratus adelaidae]|uniref:FAS1 domain-containing protein n=1 Tax=Bifiguratus adelaidae TaxID=1938954 RepID=A0A261XVS3_9FUNG|nr:hypothetical protein BZG36_04398 [Bifiguratus adelaidae]
MARFALVIGLTLLYSLLTSAQLVPNFTPISEETFAEAMDQDRHPFEATSGLVFQNTETSSNEQTLLDKLPRDKSLSIFLDVVMQVPTLVHMFNNATLDPAVTVFTPTNGAFKAFFDTETMTEHGKESGRRILASDADMHEFLAYHVVPSGKLTFQDLAKASTLETMAKKTIDVKHSGKKAMLNGKVAVSEDSKVIEAKNGIAYKVDRVLTSLNDID